MWSSGRWSLKEKKHDDDESRMSQAKHFNDPHCSPNDCHEVFWMNWWTAGRNELSDWCDWERERTDAGEWCRQSGQLLGELRKGDAFKTLKLWINTGKWKDAVASCLLSLMVGVWICKFIKSRSFEHVISFDRWVAAAGDNFVATIFIRKFTSTSLNWTNGAIYSMYNCH